MAVIEPIKLEFAAGLMRQNTAYSCPAGRWNDGALMRMTEDIRKPVGGWTIGLAGVLSGTPKSAIAWKDNDGLPFAMFATNSRLYAHDGIALDDISPTPAADDWLLEDGTSWLTEGGLDMLVEGFEAGDADTSDCTLDNYGEIGIACFDSEGAILEWQPGGGGDATVIANSPNSLAITVTAERFIFALGSDYDPRRIAWPDGENYTTWAPASTNRAREYRIQSPGVLMCGARVSGGHLIWTSHDIHFARYVGLPDVYSIRPVGNQCGIIGRHAYCTVDQLAYWMGESCFWMWAGYAEPIPCDISDDVFKNINKTHRHKTWTWHNAADGEIWFFYPRGSATECSHAAVYVYRGRPHWNHTPLARSCGFIAGTFSAPMMVSSEGTIFAHETGYSYSDDMMLLESGDGWLLEDGTAWLSEGAEAETRNLVSGPFEISNGGALLFIDELLPDELMQGDIEAYIYTSEYPTDAETMHGPFSAASRIPIEVPARKIRIEFRATDGVEDFRIGTYRAVVREWSGF